MQISDLFDQFQISAFRLEALPRYKVDDEVDALAQFEATGTLPANHNEDWAELIRGNIAAGKTMKRLRLFEVPLNSYETFERAVYETNVAAGEEIHAADRAEFQLDRDFWCFDNKWIAKMIYDEEGGWHGADVSEMTPDDHEMVDRWLAVFNKALNLREAFPIERQ
ncbi:DUF6879 family protein [Mesorhizobium japonicum]|uniref:DUF6879 family protein n=1 Tax=Mesorhizobium japonicum TaxID=2066070 RepID=UPI003B5A1687